jgi:hypothetical protein
MTIIQIKRTAAVTAPTTGDLVEAELAYAEDKASDGVGAILYIESVNNDDSAAIHKIGGKYYTDKADAFLTNQTASVGGKVNFLEGTNNGSHKVIVKAPNSLAADLTLTLPSADGSNGHVLQTNGSGVLSFSAPASSSFTLSDNQGTPNTDSFSTGSTLTFAGTAGIKTTISDNQVGIVVDVNGTTVLTSLADADEFLVYDASATANRKITAEDIGDYIYAGLSGDITVTEGGVVSIAANSVALGTDTTGNYVATLAGTANQLTVTGSGSETAAVTVALTTDVTLVGDLTVGGNDIKMNGGGAALTFSGSGDVTTNGDLIVGGQDIKSANGTTAITLVDTTGNVTVAGDLKVGGNDILASDGATALTLAVSTGDVTVAGDLIVGGNDIKSSGGTVALTLSGANVTVAGNLTVSGTTTTVNSTTVSVVDPLLALASNNDSTDAVDIGLFGTYDTSGTQDLFTGLFRDASDDKWKLFKSLQAAPTTTVNTSGTGYAIATLIANLESASVAITGGSITGITDITVADGGTGVSTFTSNGIVYGNGSGALQVTAAGTTGYFLYSNAGTPAWTNTLDGGSY